MPVDICSVCQRPEQPDHPLVTSDSDDLLCHRHVIDVDGALLNPEEYAADLDARIDVVKLWARDRHTSPPAITTFPEAKAEQVATWVQMDELMCLLQGLHVNLKRVMKEAGVR